MRPNIVFLIVVTILTIVSVNAHRLSCKKHTALFVDQEQLNGAKPVIIFDLINVLFKEKKSDLIRKIGYGDFTNYTLTHWKSPSTRCFEMLNAMSELPGQKSITNLVLNGKVMPHCIVELYRGAKNCQKVKTEIATLILELEEKQFFSGEKEQSLMSRIMNLILDPDILIEVTEPVKNMVAAVERLVDSGYELYLCANAPAEFYERLTVRYPKILSLFRGTVVSCQVKMVKPEKEIFNYLLSHYQLNPAYSILVDYSPDAITAAQQLGMRGIIADNGNATVAQLKKLGVIGRF